ncbi:MULTISPECIES: molybdopterin molybdotransferase MoeA [Sphingomonas]|uniref:molybdopterin molybdotransferase MoeA n=1 Tax=Sphingomonas TaxID=13687 RepID=UPI000DEFB05C|nr:MULTISPECIES: molybdopterin molybdotransferase MoeA [Sphingomonas]
MIGFDEAAALLATLARTLGSEEVALAEAAGRVLAAPVVAGIDSPRADVSAMDGYAVREAEVAAGAALPIVGKSYPGAPFDGELAPGSCVRLFTGAALPAGADRVVIQEEVDEADGVARFRGVPAGPRFVRPRGSDFRAGETLLEVGQRLTPGALMAAGGGDAGSVTVWRRPRVGLLVTGDELVAPGEAAATVAAVPDSVSAALAALVETWGGTVGRVERLGDDLDASVGIAGALLDASDVLVISGGASVGEKDFAKAIFAALGGELLFSKVAMKPGKPVWAGPARGKSVLGLPGNPTSALVTARLFLAPLLCGLGGRAFGEALRFGERALAAELAPVGDRETFLRGFDGDGSVALADHQDSNGQRTPASADLLVRVAAGTGALAAGTRVAVLPL